MSRRKSNQKWLKPLVLAVCAADCGGVYMAHVKLSAPVSESQADAEFAEPAPASIAPATNPQPQTLGMEGPTGHLAPDPASLHFAPATTPRQAAAAAAAPPAPALFQPASLTRPSPQWASAAALPALDAPRAESPHVALLPRAQSASLHRERRHHHAAALARADRLTEDAPPSAEPLGAAPPSAAALAAAAPGSLVALVPQPSQPLGLAAALGASPPSAPASVSPAPEVDASIAPPQPLEAPEASAVPPAPSTAADTIALGDARSGARAEAEDRNPCASQSLSWCADAMLRTDTVRPSLVAR